MNAKETLSAIREKCKEIEVLIDNFKEPVPIPCQPTDDGPILELPDNFFMATQANKTTITHTPFNNRVGNNRWMSETFNGAYYSVNAWGFGGNAGGTQELKVAQVSIEKDQKGNLKFQWWVGGFHRNFSGNPQHGWWSNSKGGNDVKAYPRLGIGSASGQEVSTVGAPFSVPCKRTGGWKHVDQVAVRKQNSLPDVVSIISDLTIRVKYKMKGGLDGLVDGVIDENQKFGSFFLAVDSYLHDVDDETKVAVPELVERISGINDTSGSIYGQQMNDLPKSTKDWAVMIWLAKSPFYETSGGTEIGNIFLDDAEYIVKYKVETAGGKKFKYLSFTRNIEAKDAFEGDVEIDYIAFSDFYTSNAMQKMFEDAGPLLDVDGVKKIIDSPHSELVLSDVNFGIETLCNPDTPETKDNKFPVSCEFEELSFKTENGTFGFKK